MPKPLYIMIGGFLGAGKTTAIHRLAAHLHRLGRRVGLITNDQSIDLVDTARVRAAGFDVEEVTGSCFCCQFDSLVEACQALTRRTAPDVLIAEPVGSCTDLQATVSHPLRQMYGDEYRIAPLSVLVDPLRCAGVLGLLPDKHFSDKVLYVYRKQLEESQALVINKIDLLPSERGLLPSLHAVIAREFPNAQIFEVSCRTGAGLEVWLEYLLNGEVNLRGLGAMDVDYDQYAEGEALLGWLNVRAELSAAQAFDGNALLLRLAQRLQEGLVAAGLQIAHLKMALAPREGNDLGSLSLPCNDEPPQATHSLAAPLDRGDLTINLRAEADPEVLKSLVLQSLDALAPLHVDVIRCAAFRPGRPKPTHRLGHMG